MSWKIRGNGNLFLKVKTKMWLYKVDLWKLKYSPGKITLTLVETQQLPDSQKADSKEDFFAWNGQFTMVGEKCASFFKLIQTRWILSYTAIKTTHLKDTEMELKLAEYEKLLARRVYPISYIDVFF